MNRKGITLVELVVVLSVMAVLIVSTGFSYRRWAGSYEVERETKELYADLMRARIMAMQEDREHFFTTNQASYTIYADIDEDGNPDPGEELPSFPKKVKYGLISSLATLSLNARGMLSQGTLHFNLTDTGLKPDYDCMTISRTRIRLGKYIGTTCKSD